MSSEPAAVEAAPCRPPRTASFVRGRLRRLVPLRRSEWLLLVFFLHLAVLVQSRRGGVPHLSALALLVPLLLIALAQADSRSTAKAWSMVRDWVPAPLLLMAYWSADWVPRLHAGHALENALIGWDRTLLNDWGLRSDIEKFGSLAPATLELAYLLIFAVLPLAIAYFYIRRQRKRLEDFLFPFLLGALLTYSLLPYFPSEAPRLIFAGQDLPGVETVFRRFNMWILKRCDIHSSVFPSGHVTVAFSAAFAMLLALPENRRIGWILLAIAVLVFVDTVYGRYHYLADGVAGLGVSLLALSIGLADVRGASDRRR